MAPQPIEKTEYALGNGMGLEASTLLDLVHGAAGPLDPQKRWGRLNRVAEKGAYRSDIARCRNEIAGANRTRKREVGPARMGYDRAATG